MVKNMSQVVNSSGRNQFMEEFQSITGKGVKAKINQEMYFVGSPRLFKELHNQIRSNQKEKKDYRFTDSRKNSHGVRDANRNPCIHSCGR